MRMIRRSAVVPLLLAAAACTTTAPPPVARGPVAQPPPYAARGLEAVLGHDARDLAELFGEPDLDVREDRGRKLQYAGAACVLDAYLYPAAAGREPTVTWLDARTPAGEDFDRASCVAALTRRAQAR